MEHVLCWPGPQSGHVLSYVQEMLIKSCYCLDIGHRGLRRHSNVAYFNTNNTQITRVTRLFSGKLHVQNDYWIVLQVSFFAEIQPFDSFVLCMTTGNENVLSRSSEIDKIRHNFASLISFTNLVLVTQFFHGQQYSQIGDEEDYISK